VNVLDSSAWLEYFADGPNANDFAPVAADTEALAVPSITIFEVFKRVRAQRDSGAALRAVAQMKRGQVIDLDGDLAIMSAELSVELGLPLADSVIIATARSIGATLWTQDSDFLGMNDVEYRAHIG
jgi:toxin FitB